MEAAVEWVRQLPQSSPAGARAKRTPAGVGWAFPVRPGLELRSLEPRSPLPPQGQNTTLRPFDRLKPAPPAAALRYQNWKFQVWPAEMGAGAVG